MSRCRLLALPVEIRDIILKELLYQEQDFDPGYQVVGPDISAYRPPVRSMLHPAILSSCRKLHTEGRAVLDRNTAVCTIAARLAFHRGQRWRTRIRRKRWHDFCSPTAGCVAPSSCLIRTTAGLSSLRIRLFFSNDYLDDILGLTRLLGRAIKHGSRLDRLTIELYDFQPSRFTPHAGTAGSIRDSDGSMRRWLSFLHSFQAIRDCKSGRFRVFEAFDISPQDTVVPRSPPFAPTTPLWLKLMPPQTFAFLEQLMCSPGPPKIDTEAAYDALEISLWRHGDNLIGPPLRGQPARAAAPRDQRLITPTIRQALTSCYQHVMEPDRFFDIRRDLLEMFASYCAPHDDDRLAAFVEDALADTCSLEDIPVVYSRLRGADVANTESRSRMLGPDR